MKVLLLTPRYPYKVDGGGLLKTKKIIDFLSRYVDLKIVSLNTDLNNLACSDAHVEYPLKEQVYNPNALNLIKSYFKNTPLSIARNNSPPLYNDINSLINDADVIFVDHFIMYQYIPKSTNKKIILHQHNAEYKIWSRRANNEDNIIKRIILSFEALRVKKFEKKICGNANLIYSSPNDKDALINIGIPPEKIKITYHLGDDSLLQYPISKFDELNNDIVFLGNLFWEPNLDGLTWFLAHIWPLILDKTGNSKIYIIGNISDNIKNLLLESKNVVVCGFVDDLNTILSKCKVFISPLRFGSGMKVKNITALYKGMPIVTTSIGAEGIDLVNGVNAFIHDDPDSFSKAIIKLLDDPKLCQSMATNARNLAEKKYSWDKNLTKLLESIQK
ncbi:glycosyltransferase family 4 protein [Providencia sp. PROV215]|uniref:glycosyltransferase family 4 protein n=1 Tax=Providencia sp. PROV215 TaxID=2949911 RepID=UPI0023499E73|nr:glycosyltransferase family 4 protein [Providencia sp. PROV215]